MEHLNTSCRRKASYSSCELSRSIWLASTGKGTLGQIQQGSYFHNILLLTCLRRHISLATLSQIIVLEF